jgi:putative Mg2+ transporter-C (MgtC) family protein
MLAEQEIILRMVAATLIGLLIGFSRRRKAAGVRTFALFCLGCAIFTIISISDVFDASATDQTRILGQVVSGIGFLGLGVIWKQGTKPTGLTTAAAIWVTAAVGMLVGLGMWTEVIVGTMLTLLIILSRRALESMGIEE